MQYDLPSSQARYTVHACSGLREDETGLDHTVRDGDKIGTGVRAATMRRVRVWSLSHVLIDLTGTGGQELSPRDRSLLYVAGRAVGRRLDKA